MGIQIDDRLLKTMATGGDPEPLFDPDEWSVRRMNSKKKVRKPPKKRVKRRVKTVPLQNRKVSRRVAMRVMQIAYPDAVLREVILGDIDERFAMNREKMGEQDATRMKWRDYADIASSGMWDFVKSVAKRCLTQLGFENFKTRFKSPKSPRA
jgi:hypothetical protein